MTPMNFYRTQEKFYGFTGHNEMPSKYLKLVIFIILDTSTTWVAENSRVTKRIKSVSSSEVLILFICKQEI
jgi:hypothetical protein